MTATSSPFASAPTRWRVRPAFALGAALFLGSWLAYVANCRLISSHDSLATSILPFAIWNGDGLSLDRYVGHGFSEQTYSFTRDGEGHWRNVYPPGAALLAAPLYAPLVLAPEIDPALPAGPLPLARVAEKYAAATLSSLAVALLFSLLRRLTTPGRAAILAAVFALATPMLSVASQALWQHGPAALALIAALRLLVVGSPGPASGAGAGALAALLAATRPVDLLLALPLLVIAMRRDWRRVGVPFVAVAAAGGTALAAWNLAVFGSLLGGYSRYPHVSEFDFDWTAVAGLMVSHRGLLLFCPFLPLLFRRGGAVSFLHRSERIAILSALVAFVSYYAGFRYWSGGENYGARYLLDALPLCFLLGARSLDAPLMAMRRAAWVATVAAAIAIQVIGVITFGSGESGAASHLENGYWDLRRSPVWMGLEAGPAPVELRPLTGFGRSLPIPDADRRGRVDLLDTLPEGWPAAARRNLRLRVTNNGRTRWTSRGGPRGANAIVLMSAWRSGTGNLLRVSLFPLREPLDPGGSREVELSLLAPPLRGSYVWTIGLAETSDSGPRFIGGEPATLTRSAMVTTAVPNWVERPWTRPAATPIFDDGFEGGDLSRWQAGVIPEAPLP